MPLTRPEPLTDCHDLSAFNSEIDAFDKWLRRRARPNQVSGASRTFVVAEDRKVVAYRALVSDCVRTA